MSGASTGQGEVPVVGSINVDLVVRLAQLPVPGQTVTGGTFNQHHGGKGANQAVAAARLGAVVAVGVAGAARRPARRATSCYGRTSACIASSGPTVTWSSSTWAMATGSGC